METFPIYVYTTLTPSVNWITGPLWMSPDDAEQYGNLFGLREGARDVTSEDKATNNSQWENLFWYQLGWIEHIKVKLFRESLIEELQTWLLLRKISLLYSIPEIPAMEIRIGTGDPESLPGPSPH